MEDTCQHSSSLQHEFFQEKGFQKIQSALWKCFTSKFQIKSSESLWEGRKGGTMEGRKQVSAVFFGMTNGLGEGGGSHFVAYTHT